MHDGQNLFFPGAAFGGKAWEVDEVMCRLLAADSVRPCIVVGIWNTALRFVEYAPAAPFGLMSPEWQAAVRAERMQASPLSDAYLKFLVQELKPYVDQHYRTRPGRAHTFIMGSSMGGLISLYAQMEYPEVFGGAACISTHWPLSLKENRGDFTQAMVQYLKVHLPQRRVPRLYFDYGTTTLDAWYEPHQLVIDSLLRADYPATKWITHKFEGAAHQESSWQARLHIPLVFLLGK
jgi:enterochelin esterase-like enzyme